MFLLNLSLFDAFSWVMGFLIALSIHEAAHAASANYLGDPTAKFEGRVTLNPLKHLDAFGTLFLLFVGFGWGKPVPVNPRNFANPRVGELLTSLAGPLSNFTLALALALPYNFLFEVNSLPFLFLQTVIFVNLVIMVFNLLPIPPLDGGGVMAALLPPKYVENYNRNGPILLFALIAFDWVFKVGILSGFVWKATQIMFAVINLSTTFGG